MLNMKDSFAMICCLLLWVMYFAAFGDFLFGNTMQGMMVFDTMSDSYWGMFVLITTENYPDVMLLAQQASAWYCLFFVVFILTGVFFLSSVLLGVIFDNFKKRYEIIAAKKGSDRMMYIEQFFEAFDEQGLEWLNHKQAKAFFATVLDLDYKKNKHRKLIVKIMRIVDPEDNKEVLKQRIMEFFEISGFQIIGELC